MPIVIQCPSCERRLRVPDHLLGKSVRCPTCQTTFQAAEADGPAQEESAAEETAPERPTRRRPAPPPEDGVEERPSRSRRRPAPADEEDEDRDERQDEDADEEEEDRPRRRRRGGRGRRRGSADAAAAVGGPAIALMITGGLAIGLSLLGMILNLTGVGLMAGAGQHGGGPRGGPDNAEMIGNAVGGIVGGIVGICWGGIVLTGALKMKSLQGYGYAMTACIVAMIPCNGCCLLGLPFGIWGLVVLNREEVKEAFG
jgi:predicted Zn finger-like uncharacterized protein